MAARANRKPRPAQTTKTTRHRVGKASSSKWKEPRLAPDYLTLLPPPRGKNYVGKDGRPTFCNRYDSPPKRRKRQQPTRSKPQSDSPPSKKEQPQTCSPPVKEEQVGETTLPAIANVPSAFIVCGPAEWSSGERDHSVNPSGVDVPLSSECLETTSLLRLEKANDQQQEDSFHARPSIKLPIPDHIKAMLVDDWENITKNNQLVPLPHPHPVDEILNDYLAFERPSREDGSANMDILEEVVAGLREYFEKSLGRILLYRYVSNTRIIVPLPS